MDALTHVKKLRDPVYFGAYEMVTNIDAKGDPIWQEMVLTITKVVREKTKTQKQTDEMVVYFAEAKKMIFNAINTKNATKAIGSPMAEHWVGKQIIVYVEKVFMTTTKEWIWATRVRDYPPVKKLPELTPQHERWKGAKEAVKSGSCTIEQIEQKFSLTPENKKLLQYG